MYQAAVITVSDKGFLGQRQDTSGPALVKLLEERDYSIQIVWVIIHLWFQIRMFLS